MIFEELREMAINSPRRDVIQSSRLLSIMSRIFRGVIYDSYDDQIPVIDGPSYATQEHVHKIMKIV